jgi:hypothetical protein
VRCRWGSRLGWYAPALSLFVAGKDHQFLAEDHKTLFAARFRKRRDESAT